MKRRRIICLFYSYEIMTKATIVVDVTEHLMIHIKILKYDSLSSIDVIFIEEIEILVE